MFEISVFLLKNNPIIGPFLGGFGGDVVPGPYVTAEPLRVNGV